MARPTATLDQIVRRTHGLYTLPAVALKVLELTSSPETDSQAVTRCIENDPALTSKLLRVVNSSLFGLSRPVGDLRQAVALLGTKPLKLLVLGFSLPDRLLAGVAREQLACYWRDALTKAVAGREISEVLWRGPGDEAFLAGLLADIGMLVLIQELGDPYGTLLERVEREQDDLPARELEWLGFDHATLSARLLAHWGLPKPLIAAVAAPPSIAELQRLSARGPLPQIVYLARLLAVLLARRRISVLPDLLEAGDRFCGLTRPGLSQLVRSLEPKVAQLAELLAVELPADLDYCDVLGQAHARLADEVSDVVAELIGSAADGGLPSPELPAVERSPRGTAPCRGDGMAVVTSAAPTRASARPAVIASPADHGDRAKPVAAKLAAAGPVDGEQAEAALLGRLAAMVMYCRTKQCELSLLLVEMDDYDKQIRARGDEPARRLATLARTMIGRESSPQAAVLQVTGARWAMALPGCDRRTAIEIGRGLVDGLTVDPPGRSGRHTAPLTLSIGIATVTVPPKNFSARALIASAERCLYAARSTRTSSVKSIEVY